MEQFVLIPQSLYEEKFSQLPKKLDPIDSNVEKIPQIDSPNLESIYAQVNHNLKTNNTKKLIDNILQSPRIKLSATNQILLDNRETGVSFVDFIITLKRKYWEFPSIFYTILEASGISSKEVVNVAAKQKQQGQWMSFNF